MATFIWPTNTKRVTSGFRTKERPTHQGVDIADSGARPIYAVADGTVSRSYVSASYGEVIFILHDINGQQWETVYAHMRGGSRGYHVGQVVKKGAQIGIMGNTGHSYGQHLHFEIHRGRWNYAKSYAVDPINYLDKTESNKSDAKQKLVLPATSDSWRVYDLNVSPKIDNEKAFLNPAKFGGLEYEILGSPQPNVFTIQTSDFGKVNIFAGPNTNAKIVDVKQTKTVYLPSSATSWRAYPLDKAPTKGNEVAMLNPKKFGGLSYEILGNPQTDVVTIQTSDFGKVNIYVANSTGANIK